MKLPLRLPFRLPDLKLTLSRYLDFSSKELKITVIALASVLFLAVVLTAIASGLGSRQPAAEVADVYSSAGEGGLPVSMQKPFLSDFIILEDRMEESFTEVLRFREPQKSWTDDMVREFWIDPKVIAEDLLEIDAQKAVRDIFADVQ